MTDQLLLPADIKLSDLEVTFSRSKRATVNKIFVDITGNFTIKHVERISDAIQMVINHCDQITLRLTLQQVDLSALQLLYNCLKKGDKVKIEVDLPPIVRQLLVITGLSEIFNTQTLTLEAI